jgi:hypothetical protein
MVAGHRGPRDRTRDVTVLGGLRRCQCRGRPRPDCSPPCPRPGRRRCSASSARNSCTRPSSIWRPWEVGSFVAAVLSQRGAGSHGSAGVGETVLGTREEDSKAAPTRHRLSMLLGPVVLSVVGLIVRLAPGTFEAALGSATAPRSSAPTSSWTSSSGTASTWMRFKGPGIEPGDPGAGMAVYLRCGGPGGSGPGGGSAWAGFGPRTPLRESGGCGPVDGLPGYLYWCRCGGCGRLVMTTVAVTVAVCRVARPDRTEVWRW